MTRTAIFYKTGWRRAFGESSGSLQDGGMIARRRFPGLVTEVVAI
jgi:hypothetical protein